MARYTEGALICGDEIAYERKVRLSSFPLPIFFDNGKRLALRITPRLLALLRWLAFAFILAGPTSPALADSFVVDATLSSTPQFHQKAWPWRVTSGPSGKVYVTYVDGGYLTGINNQRRGAVIRFNEDGTVDPSFNVGTKYATAFPVVEQANGQVLIGALDSNEADSGPPLYRVFRLNANGTRDMSYQSPVFGALPRFMTQQPDGKLLVTNQDLGEGNGGLLGLQRLNSDGSLDTSFVPPIADSFFFTNIVVDSSGKILVGGWFGTIAGQPRPGIARLLSNGALDSTFVPTGIDVNLFPKIRGIAVQTQGANAGKIVIAGGPLRTTTGSQTVCPSTGSVNCPLLRLNIDGSLDTSFTLVSSASTGVIVIRPRLLNILPNDQLMIADSGVARFNADGSLDSTYSKPLFSSETSWIDTLPDGRVYVPIVSAGSTVNGNAATQQILRFNADGTADAGFAPGVFQSESYPGDLAVLADGGFLTWGDFDTVGTTARTGAARFKPDGSLDNGYALTGVTDLLGISSAGMLNDGRLLAMIKIGTDPLSYSTSIARFGAAGALDLSYTPDSAVVAQASGFRVLPDGKALLWAAPTAQSVISASPVFFTQLSVDGPLDNTFIGLTGANGLLGAVYSSVTSPSVTTGDFSILGRYADGRLIAAVTQSPYPQNATSFNYTLLRLNVDGTPDSTFVAPTVTWSQTYHGYTALIGQQQYAVSSPLGSPFSGVLPQYDGSVIVYGTFTALDGQAAAGIARLKDSGALDTAFSVGTTGAEIRSLAGRIAQVKHVASDTNGHYWVSGVFDTFAGQSAPGLVRLNANGAVDAGFSTPLTYLSYVGGNTRVVFDVANRPVVIGSFLPSADGFPDPIHRLGLNLPMNMVASWNLLGNSGSLPLDVPTVLGNPANVATVWKWVPSSAKWAFYTPSMADGGAAYATAKGYDLLSVINGGEGFWVNAKTAFTLQLPAGAAIASTTFADQLSGPNNLPTGWSLIATGDNPTPRSFANSIALTPPSAGSVAATSLTSLWAWDSALTSWYFYAPILDNAGTLNSYITNKNYLDFTAKGKVLDPTTGFWVNHP